MNSRSANSNIFVFLPLEEFLGFELGFSEFQTLYYKIYLSRVHAMRIHIHVRTTLAPYSHHTLTTLLPRIHHTFTVQATHSPINYSLPYTAYSIHYTPHTTYSIHYTRTHHARHNQRTPPGGGVQTLFPEGRTQKNKIYYLTSNTLM